MCTTSEKTAKQKIILAKAVLAAAERIDLTQDQLALMLNINSVNTLTSLELDPTSKQGELALTLIRITISLDALTRSEEHTSERQSRENLVCRLLLEKTK